MKLSPVQQKIWNLRELIKLHAVMGDYKEFVAARKEYAKAYMSSPKEALSLPKTSQISVKLFSEEGWNMLKIMLRDLFRIKSPEEKALKKYAEELKAKQKFNINA